MQMFNKVIVAAFMVSVAMPPAAADSATPTPRYAAQQWMTGNSSDGVTAVRGLSEAQTFKYVSRHDYNWGDAEDGEYEPDYGAGIVITGGIDIKGDVAIPSQIDGLTVTGIGRKAFKKNKKITSVAIPETVNRIGYNAFGSCTALKAVTVAGGEDVDMGQFSFSGCSGLAKGGFAVVNGVLYHYTGKGGVVTIPSTVRIIDDEVFRGNRNITAVNIPSSVKVIRSEAFEHCTKLTRVSIAEGLESLGDDLVFNGCTALTRINIPGSFDSLEGWRWGEMLLRFPKLKSISIPDMEEWNWLLDEIGAKTKVNATVSVAFNPAGGAISDDTIYENGVVHVEVPYLDALGSVLPQGLYAPMRKGYTFQGWFTAKSKGSRISVNTTASKSVTYYAQWKPKRYKITVKAGKGGKVGGGGAYNCGSTAKIKATPGNGYVFVRWEDAGADVASSESCEALWANYAKQYRQPSLSLSVPPGNLTLRAVFAKKADDSAAPAVSIGWDGPWNLETDGNATIPVTVSGSLSRPSVKAANMPAGVSLAMGEDDEHYVIKVSDKKKLKPGTSTVTITATNRAGKKDSAKITIIRRNATAALDKGFMYGLKVSTTNGYTFKGGIAQSWTLADLGVSLDGGCRLAKVTGLPSGWKFANGKVSGVAAPGTYAIFFTVTKGRTSIQASATFTIEPLPEWTVGTYYGTVMLQDQKFGYDDMILSRVAMTVSSAGKVSGSFYDPMAATKCTFAGTGLVPGMHDGDEETAWYDAKVDGKMGKRAVTFNVCLARNRSAEFSFTIGAKTYYTFNCYQSYGTKSYGADDEGIASLEGKTLYDDNNTAFAFGKGGSVKVVGTFVHPVSKKKYTSTASAQIVRDDDTGKTYIPTYIQYQDGSCYPSCYEIVFDWNDDGVSYGIVECWP